MPRSWMTCALLALAVAPVPVLAQTPAAPMTALELAVACAPPARLSVKPLAGVRIAGGQDTTPRTVFGAPETVVIAAGTKDGVDIGQRYYVRRSAYQVSGSPVKVSGMTDANARLLGHMSHTVGWVRVIAANESTAIGEIEHSCGVMSQGDYLEPFTPPVVPSTVESRTPLGDIDFSSAAHVLFGDEERISAATGEFILANGGAKGALTPGARFAIYRDLHEADLPLTVIGEAVVISEGPDVAVLRIVRARDAIYGGDYLFPEKK